MEQLEEERKQVQEKLNEGPIVMIGFRKEGADSMGKMLGIGFAHFFVTSLLLAALVSMGSPKLGFLGRTGLAFVAALYGSIHHDLSPAIWWNMPGSYPHTNLVYHVLSGLLVAVAIGAIVRPCKPEA